MIFGISFLDISFSFGLWYFSYCLFQLPCSLLKYDLGSTKDLSCTTHRFKWLKYRLKSEKNWYLRKCFQSVRAVYLFNIQLSVLSQTRDLELGIQRWLRPRVCPGECLRSRGVGTDAWVSTVWWCRLTQGGRRGEEQNWGTLQKTWCLDSELQLVS